MSTTERPASHGERPRPDMTSIARILSRTSLVAGIVIATATQQFWVLVIGGAAGLIFELIARVATRNANFDQEIDTVLARIRAERVRTTPLVENGTGGTGGTDGGPTPLGD